ncbi:MAG: adenosylcobinamide-GDP ribazoletransferase [Hyphomicrobium sp.]
MTFRSFVHALQFLTRLLSPRVSNFDPADLTRSAMWFPIVGAIIGLGLAAAVWAGGYASPWIGALLGVLVWVWITGGLHLDGLADVADALGAAHRSPERFVEVMHDPHVGTNGVIAIVLLLMAKLVLLAQLPQTQVLLALILVPVWARWGPLVWSLMLPPLSRGLGERFSREINGIGVAVYGVALTLISAWLAPVLIGALVIVVVIAAYWKYRIGGLTGDCFGASIEVMETALLFLFVTVTAFA